MLGAGARQLQDLSETEVLGPGAPSSFVCVACGHFLLFKHKIYAWSNKKKKFKKKFAYSYIDKCILTCVTIYKVVTFKKKSSA